MTTSWLNLHRLFCYGCNVGPSQTARSVKKLSRMQIVWLNLRHVTKERLDKAIVTAINAYNRATEVLGQWQTRVRGWNEVDSV